MTDKFDGLGADLEVWYKELRTQLISHGLNVHVGPSPVSGSPHKHLYAFLSDESYDGPFLQISEACELEDKSGLFVCRREHGEDTREAGYVPHAADALTWALENR